MPLYDYGCDACAAVFEAIVPYDGKAPTCSCGGTTQRHIPAPKTFSTIIVTHPKSKKLKAGYTHTHADRPKTPGKIQSAVPGKRTFSGLD